MDNVIEMRRSYSQVTLRAAATYSLTMRNALLALSRPSAVVVENERGRTGGDETSVTLLLSS